MYPGVNIPTCNDTGMTKCKVDVTESTASHENEKLEGEGKNNFHNVEWQLMN